LREAPLASSVQMGRFSLADILRSETGEAGPDGKPAPSAAQIDAAFRDTKVENLQATYQAAADSAALVNGIDDFLTKTVGADKAPSLDALVAELSAIQQRLIPFLPEGTVPAPEAPASGPAGAVGAAPKAIAGVITSRQDVLKVLDKVCEFYSRHEPSSPVPYILKRARRLAEMDFMQIIDDLAPDSIKEVQRITGEKAKEE
jgi:type VI secretion system protein ImpA